MCIERFENEGIIYWPRYIETIESIAECTEPMVIRNGWFEFMQNGPGIQSGDDCGTQLIDRGTSPLQHTFPRENPGPVRAVCPNSANHGKTITFWGINDEYQQVSETLTLAGTGVTGDVKFREIWGVTKQDMAQPLDVYHVSLPDFTTTKLATYDPVEPNPMYRVSLVTGLTNAANCCDIDCKQITCVAKMAFRKVVNDSDFLLIGNIPALKDMCQSIFKREANLIQEAEAYEASAIKELNMELESYLGDAARNTFQINGSSIIGGKPVENLI